MERTRKKKFKDKLNHNFVFIWSVIVPQKFRMKNFHWKYLIWISEFFCILSIGIPQCPIFGRGMHVSAVFFTIHIHIVRYLYAINVTIADSFVLFFALAWMNCQRCTIYLIELKHAYVKLFIVVKSCVNEVVVV